MIWWFLFGVLVGVSLAVISFVVVALFPERISQ